MALKVKITKEEFDKLPEPVRAEYTEKDGVFTLNVEGAIPSTEVLELKTKLAEFRDNNIELSRKVNELSPLMEKFKDVDPEEYRRLKNLEADAKKKGTPMKPDEIADFIKHSIADATKPLHESLANERKAREIAQQQADEAAFRELLTGEATKAKVRPNSVRHVLREAHDVFELKHGRLVAKEGQKHPSEPLRELTPDVWFEHLSTTDENLFEGSGGGGADPAPGGDRSGRIGKPNARHLINPSSEEMGRHADAIASGDMVVVRR